MNKQSFSPAPWTPEPVHDGVIIHDNSKDGFYICVIKTFWENAEGNVALITIAPDMYELLTAIMNRTEGKPIGSNEYAIHMACYDLLTKVPILHP